MDFSTTCLFHRCLRSITGQAFDRAKLDLAPFSVAMAPLDFQHRLTSRRRARTRVCECVAVAVCHCQNEKKMPDTLLWWAKHATIGSTMMKWKLPKLEGAHLISQYHCHPENWRQLSWGSDQLNRHAAANTMYHSLPVPGPELENVRAVRACLPRCPAASWSC